MSAIKLSMMSLAIAVFATAGIAKAQAQEQTNLTDEQKAKAAEIQKYIKEQADAINFYYDDQIAAVKDEKIRQLLPLEISNNDKVVDASFFGWSQYIDEVLRLNGVDLRDDKDFTDTLHQFRGGRLSAMHRLDLAPKLLAISERRLADEENRVRQISASSEIQIEKGRKYALEVQLPELQQKLMDNMMHPAQSRPAGMVTGIVYTKDNTSAIIGSQIVRKGGQLNNVNITAVTPDGVEFEKAGVRWTQKIGEAPNANWQK